MFWKRCKQEPVLVSCAYSTGTDDCDMVSQIRNAQDEVAKLKAYIEKTVDASDSKFPYVAKALRGIFAYRSSGYTMFSFHQNLVEAVKYWMDSSGIQDEDKLMFELSGFFEMMKDIEQKNEKIKELNSLIKNNKQKLGIN